MPLFVNGNNKIVRAGQIILALVILASIFPRIIMGRDSAEWDRLKYYTIQTNLIMAAYWFLAATKPGRLSGKKFEIFRLAGVVAIAVTGSLYFIFLHSDYMETLASQFGSGKITVFQYSLDMFDTWVNHFSVPLLALADYLFVGPHVKMRKTNIFYVVIIPFAYFVYHSANGIITGDFIYPFINPHKLGGWLPVLAVVGVLTSFILLAAFIIFILTQKKAVAESIRN